LKNFVYLFIILCISLSGVSAKELNIVTLHYPPYSYIENDKIKGINVDIATEALKRMGYVAKIQFIPWQRALFYTKYGRADAILNASYKKARAEYLYYPEEGVFDENWYCYKKKDSKITLDKSFSNISKIRLGIVRNYAYGGNIQKAIEKKKFKQIVSLTGDEILIKKLFENDYDMFIGNEATTYLLSKKLGYLKKLSIVKTAHTNEKFLLNSDKTYLAFSKKVVSKELVQEFSKIIKELKDDGTMNKIINEYIKY